jgi:hypothetical protein
MSGPKTIIASLLMAALAAAALAADGGGWAADQTRQRIAELWRESVAAPPQDAVNENLRRIIGQIKAMQPPAPPKPDEPEPDPFEPLIKVVPASAPASEESPAGALTEQELQRLGQLSAKDVPDANLLAEALYRSGHLQPAARFYEMSLEKAQSPDDKAWALLQLGNCLAASDPAAARKAFVRVTADFAKSPYAAVAEARARMIDWRQTSKVDSLTAPSTRPASGPASMPASAPATRPATRPADVARQTNQGAQA